MADSSYTSQILEYIASTRLGQFSIKKIDLFLWSVEKPAKYCVDGKSQGDRNLPWPIFWTVLINVQIFRIVFSIILVQFNKKSIESKDIVKYLQKWRRSLRSLRFRGLRKIRQSQHGKGNANGVEHQVLPLKQGSKKRNHDEMLEDELLEELLNKTYSDTDQTDSTFMVSRCSQVSTNGSSTDGQSLSDGEYHSPNKSKNGVDSSLQDTLPISANESEQQNTSSKTNEFTFVSTVDESEENSNTSLNVEDPAGLIVQSNGSSKIGKESLNLPTDPVDAMMSKLAEMEKNGKIHTKKSGKNHHGNKKKRNFSLTTSQENVNHPLKGSKSQELL